MNDKCEIIQDLIPLVNDGVASDSSKELVNIVNIVQYVNRC